jgi:hypothetical protein
MCFHTLSYDLICFPKKQRFHILPVLTAVIQRQFLEKSRHKKLLLPWSLITHKAMFAIYILSKITPAVSILTCIREVPGSNLGQDTDYPD